MTEDMRTDDPVIIRQRFGDYAKAEGHAWLRQDSRVNKIVFEYFWLVKGAAMIEKFYLCTPEAGRCFSNPDMSTVIQHNPQTNSLVYVFMHDGLRILDSVNDYDWGSRTKYSGTVQNDGSIKRNTIFNIDSRVNKDGLWTIGSDLYYPMKLGSFNEQVMKLVHQQSREDSEQSLANAIALNNGLRAIESGLNQAQYEQQQSDYTQQQMLNEIKRNADNAEKSKTISNKSNSPVAPKQKRETVAVVPIANSSSVKVSPSPVNEKVTSQKNTTRDKNLNPTDEAVVLCTEPDEQTRFRCDGPLNHMTGHAKSISGYRSPEELVSKNMRSQCPDQRPLGAPAGYMAWGCGFGATGFMNAKDTGQGLSLGGRRVYFCKPKQSGCRLETLPN